MDFILFVYGLSLLLISKFSLINSKLDKKNGFWFYLSLFFCFYGFKVFTDMFLLSGYDLALPSNILGILSLLTLIEYANSVTRPIYNAKLWRWNTVFAAIFITVITFLFNNSSVFFITRSLFVLASLWFCFSVIRGKKFLLQIMFVLFFVFCSMQFIELSVIISLVTTVLIVIAINVYTDTNLFFEARKRRNTLRYSAILVLLIICWIVTEKVTLDRMNYAKQRLLMRGKTIAVSLDPSKVKKLTGSKNDEKVKDFKTLRSQLKEIRKINNDLRSIYLMKASRGRVIFQLDSEDPLSNDYVAPGVAWTEAPASVLTSYNRGIEQIDGPYTDRWGTWVSAFVPIKKGNEVVSVIGVDMSGKVWEQALLQNRLFVMMVGLVIFVSLLVFFIIYELEKITIDRIQDKSNETNKFFDVTLDILCITDIKGYFIRVSNACIRILGYTPQEMEGKRFVDFVHPDHIEPAVPKTDFINRCRCKDGSYKWLEWHSTSYESGVMYMSARDITEKRKTEESLRQLSTAVEQSPACIVITNKDAQIEYVNPKFTELTGYSLQEAIGQNPRILKAGDMSVEHYKGLWETISNGNEWRGELHNKKKNGDSYWESASISPLKDGYGNITHYLAVKEDITERKQLEAELRKSQDTLMKASKMKDEFLSITSHDLKSPLGIVKTSMNLLLEEPNVTPSIKEYAELSLRQANKGLKLISDLLDIGKLETGAVKLELTRFACSRLLNEVVQDFISSYEQAGVTLELSCECDFEVFADYNKIGQVISNLLSNSLKYTPNGGTVSIKGKLNGDNVLFSVTDTGEGIPAEKMHRVFQKYETANPNDKRTGAGIGLSIAKYICELHQGRIWVESQMGKGSTFYFTLPYGLGVRILIVDDVQDQRFVAKNLLTKAGFVCEEAADWQQAMGKLRSENISLILLDVEMPQMNGYELLELIRKEDKYKNLPIVMYSSKQIDKERCLKLGVQCFVQKENTDSELIANINKALH